MTDKVHKVVEKVTVGYQYTTQDHVLFDYKKEKHELTVDDMGSLIHIDMTPNTVFMLSELLRYIKEENA